jgi:hypothetical protein
MANRKDFNANLSLTPGVSPVESDEDNRNRFNGLQSAGKPLKRLVLACGRCTPG